MHCFKCWNEKQTYCTGMHTPSQTSRLPTFQIPMPLSATYVICYYALVGVVRVPLLPDVVWLGESSGNSCLSWNNDVFSLPCSPYGYVWAPMAAHCSVLCCCRCGCSCVLCYSELYHWTCWAPQPTGTTCSQVDCFTIFLHKKLPMIKAVQGLSLDNWSWEPTTHSLLFAFYYSQVPL